MHPTLVTGGFVTADDQCLASPVFIGRTTQGFGRECKSWVRACWNGGKRRNSRLKWKRSFVVSYRRINFKLEIISNARVMSLNSGAISRHQLELPFRAPLEKSEDITRIATTTTSDMVKIDAK